METNVKEIPLEIRPEVLGETLDKLTDYQDIAKMLADELLDLYKKHGVYWEEPGENSPALIAYRALVGEK